MGKIYAIYEDGKPVYVGQTIKTINERWQEHCNLARRGKNGFLLHNKMRAHGLKHFTIKELEEIDTEHLNEREKYWIKELKTLCFENGYNLTQGGETCSENLKKKCYQYDLQGKFLKEYPSVSEASRCVNGSVSNLIKVLYKQTNIAYGYRWSYEKMELLNFSHSNYTGTPKVIYQYDLNYNFIRSFSSVHEAAIFLGNKSQGTISMAAIGKRKTAFGFIWSYSQLQDIEKEVCK